MSASMEADQQEELCIDRSCNEVSAIPRLGDMQRLSETTADSTDCTQAPSANRSFAAGL